LTEDIDGISAEFQRLWTCDFFNRIDPLATSGPGEAIGYACPETLDIIALQHGEQ
jgi:hypothetical protein